MCFTDLDRFAEMSTDHVSDDEETAVTRAWAESNANDDTVSIPGQGQLNHDVDNPFQWVRAQYWMTYVKIPTKNM